MKLTNLRALKGKGVHHESPLGIAPGADSCVQGIMKDACSYHRCEVLYPLGKGSGWVFKVHQ